MRIPKIIDNQRKIFLDVIKELAPKYEELSIATGYWDLLGSELVIEELKKFKKIRLLIGREPLIPRHELTEPEPDYPDNDIFRDLERLTPNPKLQQSVRDLKSLIQNSVLEVRVYRKTFLHAKCYIFGGYDSEEAVGIIGSSNFTKNGLTHNTELNALESDHRIVTFKPQTKEQEVGHLFWFDQLWSDESTEEWDGKFTELLGQSPVGDELFSPYEMYIKTLFELYKDELEDEDIETSIKGKHELLDFQKKNVQALMRRLNKYRVAMLSDSVGLGKTYTAIEVIKQYLDSDEGKRRVEVICPKSLRLQWRKELGTQGINGLNPIVLQNRNDIEEAMNLDHIASVSLFVIDESHNLRKTSGKRYEQLLEWMRNNPKAHILLLTATPINNQLNDITNQVLLGARGRSDIFRMTVVDSKTKQSVPVDFAQAIHNLLKKINQDVKRGAGIDYGYIRQIMTPIIRTFVVRRTRQGIEKEYGYLMIDGKEKRFPKAVPQNAKYDFSHILSEKIRNPIETVLPVDKIYSLDPASLVEDCKDLLHPLDQIEKVQLFKTEAELKDEAPMYFIFQLILMLGFMPYRWRMYQTKYYGKTLDQIQELGIDSDESKHLQLQLGLYGILRTVFLKRMESSVASLRISIENYQRKLHQFEAGIKKGFIVSLKDADALQTLLESDDESIDTEERDEDLEDAILDEIKDHNYQVDAIQRDIKKEHQILDLLLAQVKLLEQDDSKIKALAQLLYSLHFAGKKVLVFSYFADTIDYLEKNIGKHTALVTNENSAFVSSKNRGDADLLASRFSPRSKNHTFKTDETELSYLFSTDVLSEGQNLQDCGIIINYDLHWNPVRMIQRNGRVNRLGSDFETVYVYNMSPESKLENYLRLVQRLEGKIELIRNTIGTDQSVLTENPNPIEFTDKYEDIYSEDEQVRIKAMQQMEQSADFLLSEDEFVSDLKVFERSSDFSREYKDLIYKIPQGKWGAFPIRAHRGDRRPEVMSLARLKSGADVLGTQFVSMEKDGGKFSAVTQLQALEWLRAYVEDNQRSKDEISINRELVIDKTKRSVVTYHASDEEGTPTGQQAGILKLMYEHGHPFEDIEMVKKSYSTKNVLDAKKINLLVRKIAKLKKDNKPYLAELKELVAIAVRTSKDSNSMPTLKAEQADLLLFYVRENS